MAKKSKLPTITTMLKRLELRWPKITNPDTEGKYADGKFKTHGIAQTDDEHKRIVGMLEAAATSAEFKQYFKDNGVSGEAVLQLPIKEFKNKESGEVEEVGFNFKSKYRPLVIDGKKNKLPQSLKIGNGTVANIEAVMFPWTKEEKVRVKDEKTGKMKEVKEVGYGVSMRLAGVQIIKLEAGGGQSDGSAFDEEDDGFEYSADDSVTDDAAAGDDFDL
jgi:hypothetical protein